jgi:hypothetical protein
MRVGERLGTNRAIKVRTRGPAPITLRVVGRLKRQLVRVWLPALLIGACVGAVLPALAQAFAIAKWEAGSCIESTCTDAGPTSAFYTQASGHPDFGITDFRFAAKKEGTLDKWEAPEGRVENIRVDLPAGLAVNPEATPELCTEAELQADEKKCPKGSQVGVDEATGTASLLGIKKTLTEEFPVYNMPREPGQPSRFGVEINSTLVKAAGAQGYIYLEGGISWHKEAITDEDSGVVTGDDHLFFEIREISPKLPELIESRLIFWGVPEKETHIGKPTAFITLPSTCSSKQISTLHADTYEEPDNWISETNETPVTATGCENLALEPSLTLSPETTQSDQPDGASVTLHVPQYMDEPSKPDSADVQSAEITLPEGMTLNPSAAHGLETCSEQQYEEGQCPEASDVGTVSVNAPGIKDGSLTGHVYVGAPKPKEEPRLGEYRLFLAAESPEYGVGLRLEGLVRANPQTGQLTTTFSGAPQIPFESLTLSFRGGPRAPLANPLACGAVAPSAAITPYGGEPAKAAATTGFTVDSNGAGGECASSLPFSLVQSLAPQSPAQAGAYDPAGFSLTRADGQQYLSNLSTTLPAGLLGAIASVPLCGEADAIAGKCPAASQIGTVTVTAGAGGEPYSFTGSAYLTGPYDGAPYGLSVVVPAIAGPYDLGEVVTRAALSVGVYSGRVTVSATLPSIVGGVPLRLQSLNVAVNRPSFLFNPTSCAPLATESVLTSAAGASQSLSSPFQVGNCGALPFTPSLSASSGAKTSKLGGASLVVKITQAAHQANIRELQLQLPKQLVARFSTIQKACPAATFEAGPPPGGCTKSSVVGSAKVSTPVLPDPLSGEAYFVSHAAESFPDLELVLHGDGVTVVLVGHTHIADSSITTSTFESLPDVPISSVVLTLPVGPSSALAANGALCAAKLLAPTTIVAQSGAKISRDTKIAVTGCPVKVISHKRRGGRLIVMVWAPQAGRVTVSGHGIKRVSFRVSKAGDFKLRVPIGASAVAALGGRGKKLELRVGFSPKSGGGGSAASLALR